ncbi:hypothetical protein [Archaeoglobus sp.]
MGNVKEYIESYGFIELFRAFARVERVLRLLLRERLSRVHSNRLAVSDNEVVRKSGFAEAFSIFKSGK